MSGYIGTQPVPQATQTRDSFTATSGQTSFATGGYTPNFLDVYLNGVKLAAADYTATNGSDVVLASGAATGDILEVVAFTTFTPASIPDGTPSIDDNGNATALTIDSSERVMIGKTDTTFSTAGNVFYGDGSSDHTRNGLLLQLNRTTTDGEHIRLLKDGSSVGSIGVNSGDQVYFAASDGMGIKVDTDNTSVEASNASGADNDNAVNLGSSGTRWKDLYLSGGVYLGGTGSANKLDDYEEGTWTPTNTGTVGVVQSVGKYTKVGEVVHFHLYYEWNSNTSMNKLFSGLPFLVKGASTPENTYYTMCNTWNQNGTNYPSGRTTLVGHAEPNTTNVQFTCTGSNVASGNPTFNSSGALYMTGFYYTAS